MLTELDGDIWDHYRDGKWIVITTNIGWKNDYSNPMGAGIAKAATKIAPDLPIWYGIQCYGQRENTSVLLYRPARFILFPTKAFNASQPHLSWRAGSDLALIKRSAEQLQTLRLAELPNEIVAVPLVGCKNGGLSPEVVVPALAERLDDSFVLYLS
jgi:hypothetical protein